MQLNKRYKYYKCEQREGKDDVDGGLYDGQYHEDEDEEKEDEEDEEEWDGEDSYDTSERKETPLEKKLKSKMQDELYKFDYEDIVAGIPTRFKYRTVEPNDYGLTTQEILFARDSTLKQFVSLKRMAPYGDEQGEFRVGGKKRRRFREQLKHDLEEEGGGNEVLTDNVHAEVALPKKKKARRLKKGRKKNSPALASMESGSADMKDTAMSSPHLKKRSRKKSGKKTNGRNDAAEDIISMSPAPLVDSQPKSDQRLKQSSKIAEPSLAVDKKKKKKKGKKHKVVSGITSSRLASYGL